MQALAGEATLAERMAQGVPEANFDLVFPCHELSLFFGDLRVLGFMQQGHRARRRARARAMWMWSVAMEPGW